MLSTLVPAVAALSFSDMPNDYSTVALQAAIDNGLLNGSDGKILPNDYLTRAQMATIIVRAFGATNEASLAGFSDVTGEEWYAPYLAKAVYMKVLQGDGTRLMPTDPITRQQVFTILARALKLEDGTRADLAAFSDASSVAPWAVGPTAALVKAGFIHGSDGKLNPTANILRKDFAVVMHNIFKKYITQPGTYTELPEGCVLINVPGVTLKNVTVKGDLVIGDGVGDGDVVLENVTITGRMVVRGGGLSSIIIRGSSSVGTVIVSKVDGNVRVFVEGDADVEVVYIDDGKDDVIVEGEVDKLVVSASDVPVTIKGTVDEVTVSGAKATITVDGEVGTLTTTSSATNTAVIVNDGANVEKVNANAAGTSVSGDGSVGSVNAAANNVNVSTVGTNVTAAPGVSGVKAGDKDVKPGETAKVEQGTTPGTGGGGGGGFPIGGGGAGEEPEPVASTYKFSYEVPADVVAGQEVVVPVTFETDGEPGDIGYDGVRFKFAAEGPEGATVTFKAVDSNNVEYTFTNEGYWGPPGGFDLPAQYSATTDWTLVFSKAGEYTITFSLVDLDAGEALVTETVTIEVIGAVGPVEALITDLPEVPDDKAPELPDFSKPKPDGEKLTAIYNYLAYLENAEAVAAAKEAFDALDPSDQAKVEQDTKAKLDAAVAKISELKAFVIDNTTIGVGTYKEDYSGLTEGAKGRIMVSVQWPFRVADGFNTEEGLTSIEEYLYNDKRGELVRNVAVLDKMNPSTTGNWPCNLSGSFDLGVQRISSSGSWNNGLYELSGDEVTQADLPDKVVVEFTYKGVQFVIEEEVTLTPEMFAAEPSNDASITGITVSGVAATVDTGDEEGLDVTPLEDAIEAAEAAKESIVVSEDGADVPTGAYWVTQADIDALDAAIAKAEAAKETVEIQQGVDNAVAELEAVIATFNDTKQEAIDEGEMRELVEGEELTEDEEPVE